MERPPGPSSSALSSLRALRRDPIRLFTLAASFGDVSFVQLPRTPTYVLNHPDLVHDMLAGHHRDFRKGPTMEAAKRMLGESLLTSEGEHHRQRRKLIQPIFHHERVAARASDIVDLGERAAGRWASGESLDLHAEMSRLTLAIVGRTLFDVDVETDRASEVGAALAGTLAQFNRVFSPFLRITERLPLPANRRFQRARETFDRIVYEMIDRRIASGPTGEDVLSRMLRARENGIGLTREQVRDEALTLFLAGHETTSNALTWTWYLLSGNATAEKRLQMELDASLGDRSPSAADVERLPFTRAVLHESMRRFPPAWAIGRRALVPREAGGYEIPAGAVLVVSPWLLHHDPRWWEDPWAFRPERFLEDDPTRPRHAFLPFGAGPRMCVGADFAELEATLLIAAIARRWRFEHDPTHRVELQPAITLRPRHGMRMTAHRRVPARAR